MASDKRPLIAELADVSGTALSKVTQVQPGDRLSHEVLPVFDGTTPGTVPDATGIPADYALTPAGWAEQSGSGSGTGDVSGPATSTTGNVPTWTDTTGEDLSDGFPVSTAAKTVLDDASIAAMRATLGVDAAGTDNSTPVTLAGTPDYITLSGQTITRGPVDLATDVTGILPHGNLGTGGGTGTKFLRDDNTFQTTPGGGDALTSGSLAQFAATSSAQLRGVLTDETGTGSAVFGTSPALVTPALGVASATSVNKVAITAPATSATLTIADGATLTAPSTASVAGTNTGDLSLAGSLDYVTLSGQVLTRGAVDMATDVTGILPHGNLGTGGGGAVKFLREDSTYQTIPGGGDAQTSASLAQFAPTTSAELRGVLSDETGTGAAVFGTSPVLTTPNLGTPSAATLTNATGLPTGGVTVSATDRLLGRVSASGGVAEEIPVTDFVQTILDDPDAATVRATIGAGVGNALTSGHLGQFAATTSAQLAGVISDETGSGALVLATSPTLVTPTLGVASATSVNKVTITAPATSATLTIADGASLVASANATVAGSNTGDQTITGTGDVTGSGTGTFALTIAADAVTNAKLANAAANSFKANITGSSDNPTDVVLADLTAEAAPAAGDFLLAMIDTGALRKIDIANMPAGTPAADSIANTMLANMAEATIKGRAAGAGTGDPTDLSAAQVVTLTGAEVTANKNVASGYAGLDTLGQVPVARQRPRGWDKLEYAWRASPGLNSAILVGAAFDYMTDGELTGGSGTGGHYLAVDAGAEGHGGLQTAFNIIQTRWSPELHFAFKTGASLAGTRFWIGISAAYIDATAPVANGGTFSIASACFTWDATVHSGSDFWRAHTSDGSGAAGATVTTLATAIATSTNYGLRIVANPGSNILFYINDVLVATHTTDLPSVSSLYGIVMRVVGVDKTCEWKRVVVIHD